MTIEDMQIENFLRQLYQMSNGDISTEVSMYDIGATLGLEKPKAGAMAEDLIIDGLAELKTLTGGISITVEGLQALDVNVPASGSAGDARAAGLVLGDDKIIGPELFKAVEQLVVDIKEAVGKAALSYDQMEEVVVEIKTMETQLLSSRPKTAIIREVLRSLSQLLKENDKTSRISTKIWTMIAD